MKHNGRNIITSNDVTVLGKNSGKSLETVLESLQETQEELKSNVKWIYKYGGVGGGGGKGGSSQDWGIICRLQNILVTDTTLEIYYESPGSKSLYIKINNPNGDTFIVNYLYGGIKNRIKLELDNSWTFNSNIPLLSNGTLSIEVTDGNLVTKTLDVEYIVNAYTIDVNLVTESGNKLLPYSGTYTSFIEEVNDNKLYLDIQIKSNINKDNILIKFNDFVGQIHEINTNLLKNLIYTLERVNLFLDKVLTDLDAGNYKCNVLFFIDSIDEPTKEYILNTDIIPSGLYLIVVPSQGSIYKEDNVQNPYLYYPGNIGLILTPYFGAYNQNRVIPCEIYIDDVYTNTVSLTERTSLITTVKILEVLTGVHKLSFKLTFGNESPVLMDYYVYLKDFEENVYWFKGINVESFNYKDNVINDYYGLKIENNIINDIVTKYSNDTSRTDITFENSLSVLDNYGNYDCMYNFAIQYNDTNDDSKPIIAFANNTESFKLIVYLDSLQLLELGTEGEEGGSAIECKLFIPKTQSFNKTLLQNYSLVTIIKHCIESNGNNKKFEYSVYINGCLEGTFETYITILTTIKKIIIYPGNFYFNLLDVAYITSGSITDSLVVRYWYAYLYYILGIRDNITNKLEILSCFEKLKENDPIPFEYTKDGRVMVSDISVLNNFVSKIQIPAMCILYLDSNVNSMEIKKTFIGWSELERSPNADPTDEDRVKVGIYWAPAEKGEDFLFIDESDSNLINTNNIPINEGETLDSEFILEILGSTTRMYRSKNYTLKLLSDNTYYTPIYSPNYNLDNDSSFLYEQSFTLKADVVDSSHCNNTSIGKFINDISVKFFGPQQWQNIRYKSKIKNCLEGFPFLLFARLKINGKDLIYYLGIYNFNLGRSSILNLGYCDTRSLDLPLSVGNNGFSITTISKNIYKVMNEFTAAEVQDNDATFDFSLFDNSILFKLDGVDNDKKYMFGDIVSGEENVSNIRTQILNFVKRTSNAGYYIFNSLSKGFHEEETVPSLGYNVKQYVPNARILYKRSLNLQSNFEYVGTELLNYNPSQLDLQNYLYTHSESGDENTPAYVDYQSLLEYYLICMAFGLLDSVLKNLNIKSWNLGKTFYIAFYDMDTALGVDNNGYDATYYAFSDYWENRELVVENLEYDCIIDVIDIWRDYAPNKNEQTASGDVLYDVPSTYLFAIPKYAKSILKNSMEEDSPQDLWDKWRKSDGCLRNAKYFIDTYYKGYMNGVDELMFNYNYRAKYFKQDSTKFNDEVLRFKGRRIYKVLNWLDRRFHMMDAYMNLANSSSLISDGANFNINDVSKYYFESQPTQQLSRDNSDVYVNKHIFSESRSFANNATDFVIKAPDYTPLILSSSKGTYKFLLRDKTKKYKIITNNVGNTKFTFGGSTEWTYLNSINAIADGTPLSINSNKLTLLNGDSGSINGFTIVMPALRDISLTSSQYKGMLDLSKNTLDDTVNFPNIDSVDIRNSLISLLVNGEHVKTIDLSNIDSSTIKLLNCDVLENVIFNYSKIGLCTINPIWTNSLTLSGNSILTLDLTAKYNNSTITIRNDNRIETIILKDFKTVTIENCKKLRSLTISGDKLNTLTVTNCLLLDTASINATNATSINLPSTKLSTKLELITNNDSFVLNTLNVSNSLISKIYYTINQQNLVESSNTINLIPLRNCNNINLYQCNLFEYIKVLNNKLESPFRITSQGTSGRNINFGRCTGLKRIYGYISIERSDAFTGCKNFSIHGDNLETVLFNEEHVYNQQTNVVRRDVIFDLLGDVIFLVGDNVTNIDLNLTTSLSYSFYLTKCTLFDVYYAFAIAKNVSDAKYAFSYITNLFVDPNINIDLFKNSTKIENLTFTFGYNSNAKRINLRGGLFSNFINTSVNLSGMFYAKSYCAETSLFNNEHNTKFNIYRFSPDFIADSLSNITGSESETQLIYIILNCIDLNGNASSDINHYGNVSDIVSNMESGNSYYSVLSGCVYINYDTLHNIPGLRFDSCFNSTFGTGIIRKASEIFLEKTNVVSITRCFRISGNSDSKYLRINTYGKVILNIDSDFFEGMSNLLYVGYNSQESTLLDSINYPGISYSTFNENSFLTGNINGLDSLGNVSYSSGFNCSYNGSNLDKIIVSATDFPYSILSSCPLIKMFAGFFTNSTISNDSGINQSLIKLPGSMFYNTPNLTNCIGLFSGVDFVYSLSSEGFKNCTNLSRVDFLFSGSLSSLSKNSKMTGLIPKKLFYHGHILSSKTVYGFNGTLSIESITDALDRVIGTKTIITKTNSLVYYITTIGEETKWYNSNDEEVLLQDALDHYEVNSYPVYNNKITSMIGCFVNNNRTPYTNSNPLSEVNPLYNSFDYVYNNGIFEQKEKNLYVNQITWEYDGINNVNNTYNLDNVRGVNYCCAPDLLRYCSNNCLINELFAYSGEAVGYGNTGSYGRSGNNEYGITGRIPPLLLYPFNSSEEIFNLSGMFRHCTKLNYYNSGQGTVNYIIPEDFFKNGPSKIGSLMQTFLGIFIPGNCNLDVFKYIREKTSLTNICKVFYKASYGNSTNNSDININSIFLGFDNISNMVAAFAGRNSSNDSSAFLSSFANNIQVLFTSIFSNNVYNLNSYINNGFYSYVFAYLNSNNVIHESDKTVYYDSNDTNKNYIN